MTAYSSPRASKRACFSGENLEKENSSLVGRGAGVLGTCVSQAVKEDLWHGLPGWGAGVSPAVSLPGTLTESHQISLPWQGLAGWLWKPLMNWWEKRGFVRALWRGVLLEGSNRGDAQDMAALVLRGLAICHRVFQTLCLNMQLS